MSEIAYKSELRRLADLDAVGEDITDDIALFARRAAMGVNAVRREIDRLAA